MEGGLRSETVLQRREVGGVCGRDGAGLVELVAAVGDEEGEQGEDVGGSDASGANIGLREPTFELGPLLLQQAEAGLGPRRKPVLHARRGCRSRGWPCGRSRRNGAWRRSPWGRGGGDWAEDWNVGRRRSAFSARSLMSASSPLTASDSWRVLVRMLPSWDDPETGAGGVTLMWAAASGMASEGSWGEVDMRHTP